MEILIAMAIAYLVVAPDRATLTATRGLAGAARASIEAATRPHRTLPGERRRSRSSSKPRGGVSRPVAILDGWRDGVASARKARDERRDLWSRSSRVGGRVAGGVGSLAGGIRTTVRSRRHGDTSSSNTADAASDHVGIQPARRSWTAANLVRRFRPTTAHQHDTPEIPGTPKTPVGSATPEPPSPPAEPTGPATDASTTTPTRKANPMALAGTELSNLDEVASEVKAAEAAMQELGTALVEFKKWAANLPDRWSGTNWGTRGLDAAISDLADVVSALRSPENVLEQLASVRTEVQKARTVGEAAEAARARGDVSSFRAA